MKVRTKFKETEIGMIPEDWEVVKLGEKANIKMGQSPPSCTYNMVGKGLPFFQGRKDFGSRHPTTTTWCSEPKKKANKGEVLLSVRAPIGDLNITDKECCIGRGLSALSCKNKYDEFLFYLLKYNQKRLESDFESGGTVFGCVSKSGLLNFLVAIPKNEDEQFSIASILSSLDSKIELNQQMNKTLEAIGQALFKHLFVDFEFPDERGKPYKSSGGEMEDSELREIPKGWEVKEINDCGRVICGKTPPTKDKDNYGNDIPFITIPDMRDSIFVVRTEKQLSRIGAETQGKKELPALAVCVSCIATPGLVALTRTRSHTNQQINSIICNNGISPYFMFFSMKEKSEDIRTMGLGGTATLNLNTGEFSKIKILVPEKSLMDKFHRLVAPILNRVLENSIENLTLADIRDSLLPRLMSGKIRLGSAA